MSFLVACSDRIPTILSQFHPYRLLQYSATVARISIGGMTFMAWLMRGSSNSHASNQKSVFLPFLGTFFHPSLSTSTASTMPLHALEAPLLGRIQSIFFTPPIYLSVRTLAHKEFSSFSKRHPNLVIKALFMSLVHLMPRPPFFFG